MTERCTSASNCLDVTPLAGGTLRLRSSRRPHNVIYLEPDEWEAHLAEIRAAALTEAAALLRRDSAYHVLSFTDFGAGIRHAVTALTKLASPPSATLPADDAPSVPEATPEPQGPAEGSAGVRCSCAHCWSAPDSHWYRSTCKLCPVGCDCGCGGPEPVPEADATLDRLTAERDTARAGRDALGGQLVAAHLEHQQALDQLDTARAAAEGFRDELNRTGEMLLAMTADRDQLRKRVDGGDTLWDTANWLADKLTDALVELARTRPVVEAAVAWRDAAWNTYTAGPATDLSTAVVAYTAGTLQPNGMVGDTRVAWVPQIPTPDGLPPVLGDDHG